MLYHHQESLTAAHCKHHLVHLFVLSPGVQRLEVRLHFEPSHADGVENMLTLTLFDPAGFRGAGHRGGNTHVVTITRETATPGYLPGPLTPGIWFVQVDTHMIMPGAPCHYELTVDVAYAHAGDEAAASAPPVVSARREPDRGPGWFRGDLHSHTVHSDASCTVAGLVELARRYGLDFLYLTDHNTVSSLPEVLALGDERLLTLGGVELTTFWGHAVCLGTRQWIDWRVRPDDGRMAAIARQVMADGQLFIIAHPQSVGDPTCTGCRWEYPQMMPGTAQLVEIWNGPWAGDSNNEPALHTWYTWLNRGHRLVATAGSDVHGESGYADGPGFAVVYAQRLAEADLLHSLRAGHLYLSAGPSLTFTGAAAGGIQAMMGDQVQADQVALACTWDGCPAGAVVRIVADGQVVHSLPAGVRGDYSWTLTPAEARWCVVEIRAAGGEMLAITNPIYLAPPA